LRGGLNLYGYAGGDPVNFNDPFGLSPDTLKVDASAEAAVAECTTKSPTCATQIALIDEMPATWTLTVSDPGPCGPSPQPGCVDPSKRMIYLVPADLRRTRLEDGLPVTSPAILGHEFGHVLTTGMPGCGAERCAVQHENVVRGDLGLPPRQVPPR
jgi:hypothetical protein